MYKRLIFLVLGFTLTGCPSKENPFEGVLANTTLSGTLSLLGPVEGAEVCASTYAGGQDDTVLSDCATTDVQGRWLLHAGHLFGTLVVKATVSQFPGSPIVAVVPNVQQYDTVNDIHITPVSHLTAGYYRFLVDHEHLRHAVALSMARDQLNRHFGGLPHHVRSPWIPPAQGEPKSQLPLVEGMEMYLYAGAIEGLTWKLNADANVDGSSKTTMVSLLDALYDDVAADGVFDGVGADGLILRQHGIQLHADTLRHDLAGGMALFIRSEINPTKMRIPEVRSFMTALSASQGRLFPDGGHYYEDQGPQLASCVVVREDGKLSSLDYPQRGVVEVSCRWIDSLGVKSGAISFKEPEAATGLKLLEMRENAVSAIIDTQRLENGTSYTLNLSAKNVYDAASNKNAVLRVQNEPLMLVQIQTKSEWVKPGDSLRVFGETQRPLRRVSLKPSGFEPLTEEYAFENQVTHFDVCYPDAYLAERYAATVELEDWSGAITTRAIYITGDQTPPELLIIPETFTQENGSGLVNLSAWGSGLTPTFFKFYDRMDFIPEQNAGVVEHNLPTLKFRVHDHANSQAGAEPSEMLVEYSYELDNNPESARDWEPITPGDDGVYALPVAYQTMLPRWAQNPERNFLARCQPTGEHRISVRVTDPAGNASVRHFPFFLHLLAPPVRVWDCGATGALQGAQLVNPNFDVVFATGFDLYDARMQYDISLPLSTLAPGGGMVVRVEKDPLQAHITDLKVTRGKIYNGREYLATLRDDKLVQRIRTAFDTAYLRRCGTAKRTAFEDGTCGPLRRMTAYPEVEMQPAVLSGRQEVSLMALKRDFIEEAPAGGTDITLASNTRYLLRTRTANTPLFENGRPVDWTRVPDADGTISTQLATRYGVETHRRQDTLFLERVSVAGLKLLRPPMRVNLIASVDGGLPTPDISVDASCASGLGLQWSLAHEAPTQTSL